MKSHSATLDMTRGPIMKQMLRFAFPVLLSSLVQQLYVIVDTLIVSHYLGDGALAALTNCENLSWFLTSMIYGLGLGAGVVISQAFGAKDYSWMRRVIGTCISGSLVLSVFMIPFGLVICRPILVLMQTPAEVLRQSTAYLQVLICGMGGSIVFSICSGIRQSAGDSTTPLYFLFFAGCLNIALDMVAIALLHTDVEGAAFATVFSQYVSGIIMLYYLFHVHDEQRMSWKSIRFEKKALREVFHMGIPSAIEYSATSLANAMIQGFLNSFGVNAMAAIGALASVDGFAFLPINSFCQACATFTGQNAGALNKERTYKGAKFGLWGTALSSLFMGILVFLFWKPLMGIFTSTPETLEYARIKIYWSCFFYPLMGLTHCYSSIFRGAGKPVLSMTAYLGSWGVIRVTILSIVMSFHHSYEVLCWIYPLTWAISTIFLACCYKWYPWFPKAEDTGAVLQQT